MPSRADRAAQIVHSARIVVKACVTVPLPLEHFIRRLIQLRGFYRLPNNRAPMHAAVMLMPATEAAQGVCQRAGLRFHARERLDEFICCHFNFSVFPLIKASIFFCALRAHIIIVSHASRPFYFDFNAIPLNYIKTFAYIALICFRHLFCLPFAFLSVVSCANRYHLSIFFLRRIGLSHAV